MNLRVVEDRRNKEKANASRNARFHFRCRPPGASERILGFLSPRAPAAVPTPVRSMAPVDRVDLERLCHRGRRAVTPFSSYKTQHDVRIGGRRSPDHQNKPKDEKTKIIIKKTRPVVTPRNFFICRRHARTGWAKRSRASPDGIRNSRGFSFFKKKKLLFSIVKKAGSEKKIRVKNYDGHCFVVIRGEKSVFEISLKTENILH